MVVPDAAPLPALTARDVLDDLPREAAAPDALAHFDREPQCHYAARMRGRDIGGGSSSGSGGGGSRDSGSSSGSSSHGAAVDLSAVGAPLRNHCTLGLAEDTLARIRLIPKEGQPPPPGRSRWEGECSVPAHPFQPPRAGNLCVWGWAMSGHGKGETARMFQGSCVALPACNAVPTAAAAAASLLPPQPGPAGRPAAVAHASPG